MVQRTLNDRCLVTLSPGYHWDSSLPSFGVYKGKRATTFIVLKTSGRRHKIGRYPRISLKDARRKAHAILSLNRSDDPTTRSAEALTDYEEALTVKDNTKSEYIRLLKRFSFPTSLAAIEPRDILITVKALSYSEGRHAYFAASAFLSWCVERHYLRYHPLRGVKCPRKHRSRHHTLTDTEIRNIWLAAPNDRYGEIVRLLIASAQRRAMITALDPEWVKEDHIHFPESICKNGSDHRLPTTPFLSNLLENYSYPLHNTAWSKPKRRLDKDAGVSGYTLHDFRRYFATVSAETLGTEPHVIEAVLHHQSGTITPLGRIYNRARYTEPMRAALQRYHEHLERLISP